MLAGVGGYLWGVLERLLINTATNVMVASWYTCARTISL